MITVVANLKGGSGKSTVSFNLLAWLVGQGREVKAFDLDPQRTLSDVAQVRKEDGIVPALQVAAVDRPSFDHAAQVEVIIDVGAANLEGMREAIRHADRVIVPVPPSQPDVWATQRFLKIVADARNGTEKTLEIIAFVNRADTHHAVRESDDTEAALQQLPGITVLPLRLYQRTLYRRSMSEGMAVFELWRGSKGADEFEALASALYQ
ncbi:AAA family ATPase [Sulfuriflexus mobilis]|uniref:nucleotide-binding protein n=1 Tax=Sulfuriflexus mobilis TaxID=1811807 RepID=UPI000F8198C6|nr:AAA family ATPase [Sulfuriflexus mobilis]